MCAKVTFEGEEGKNKVEEKLEREGREGRKKK